MITDEDKKLWEAATEDVTPLGERNRVSPQPRPVQNYIPMRERTPFVTGELDRNIPGLDGKRSRQIRNGDLNVNARIDLHGMTIDQAHARVRTFIQNCFQNGFNHVLVITGKGSDDRSIKREFPHWIQEPPLKNLVISCNHAHRTQGGTGAFMVVLRRAKP